MLKAMQAFFGVLKFILRPVTLESVLSRGAGDTRGSGRQRRAEP